MVARPLAYCFSAAVLVFGCHKTSGSAGCVSDDTAPATLHAQVEVVDESGAPVAGAKIDLGDATYSTDASGKASFDSPSGPAFAIVSAPGSLAEPLPIGWSQPVRVTLLSDHGGKRIAIH